MSGDIDISEVFADTCVLLNYVQQWLEHDRGSVAFFEVHDSTKVISETVETEFSNRCDARSIIYHDMLKFANEVSDGGIEDYDLDSRKPLSEEEQTLSPSDRDNVLDIQIRLVTENKAEALRKLREYLRQIETRREYVVGKMAEISDKNDDEGLIQSIATHISNSADQQVIADAVGWSLDGGSGTVTTQDGVDILSSRDRINGAIENYHSNECRLTILSTQELVEG